MKNFFAALLLMWASVDNSSAQTYCPIPDTNAFWKEVTVFFMPGNPANTVRDEFVKGDTLIGGDLYTKVYATGYTQTNSGTTYFTNAYQGAVRDDSATQRVYFVASYDTTVQLLYDFSLTVGQSTPASTVYQGQAVITSIDSIYYLNRWHQQFHTSINGPAGELVFIEGMGSNYGLTLCYCSSLQMMYCYYEADRPCWPDTTQGCASPVGLEGLAEETGLSIAPNPAANKLTVKFAETETGMISIYNQEGQLISENEIHVVSQAEIDVTSFAKGIYLLVYTDAKGIQRSRKFIVE